MARFLARLLPFFCSTILHVFSGFFDRLITFPDLGVGLGQRQEQKLLRVFFAHFLHEPIDPRREGPMIVSEWLKILGDVLVEFNNIVI